MRSAAVVVLLALAGCSTEDPAPTGTVSVQLYNRDAVPLASWPVMFHGADGGELAVLSTDHEGAVTGPIEPGGMVTYRSPFPHDQLVTRGGLQPGSHVVDGVPPGRVEPGPHSTVVVNPAPAPDNVRLWRLRIVCDERVIEARTTPGTQLAVEVPLACSAPDGTVYAYASATDETASVAGHAVLPAIALVADAIVETTIAGWRTDFREAAVTLVDLDPDLVRYRVEADALVGSAAIAWAVVESDGATDTVASAVRLPAGIPGVSRYHVATQFADSELLVDQPVSPGAPLFVGPADLLPRITSMTLADGTITFTTARPIDEPMTIEAVLVAPVGASWRLVDFAGPRLVLPELRASEFPFLPYFSVEDLALHEVAASTRTPCTHGVTTKTTAMPYKSLASGL